MYQFCFFFYFNSHNTKKKTHTQMDNFFFTTSLSCKQSFIGSEDSKNCIDCEFTTKENVDKAYTIMKLIPQKCLQCLVKDIEQTLQSTINVSKEENCFIIERNNKFFNDVYKNVFLSNVINNKTS